MKTTTTQTSAVNIIKVSENFKHGAFHNHFAYSFIIFSVIGSTQGGQLIRLEGTGFLREEISVTICDEECILLSDRSSATELYCVTPTVNGMFQNTYKCIICLILLT